MNNRTSLYVIFIIFLACLSGCFGDPNEKANKLFVQLTQSAQQINEASSYSQMFDSYRQLRLDVENLVQTYPSADIAVSLVSGIAKINGLSYDQIFERESELQPLSNAEKDPFATALLLYELIEKKEEKVFALTAIATALSKAGKVNQSQHITSQAIQVAETNKGKKDYFWRIARAFVKAGEPDQAFDIAGKISSELNRFDILEDVSKLFAETGQLDKAFKAADLIKLEGSGRPFKAQALAQISIALAKDGKVNQTQQITSQALDVLKPILNEYDYKTNKTLEDVSIALYIADKPEQAFDVIKKIKRYDALTSIKIYKSLNKFGKNYNTDELMDEIIEGVKKHKTEDKKEIEDREEILEEAAIYFAEDGNIAQAYDTIDAIRYKVYKDKPLRALANALVKDGDLDLDEALKLTEKIENKIHKSSALREIAVTCFEAGRNDQAQHIIARAIEVTETIPESDYFGKSYNKLRGLRYIAKALAENGKLDQALEVTEMIGAMPIKVQALTDIASAGEIGAIQLDEKALNRLSQIVQKYYPLEDK